MHKRYLHIEQLHFKFLTNIHCYFPGGSCLRNFAAHGDSNSNNAALGQEAGALEVLLQLTRSSHDGVRWCIFKIEISINSSHFSMVFAWVASLLLFFIWRILVAHKNGKHKRYFSLVCRQEAAGALWNLSFMTEIEKQLQLQVALRHWYAFFYFIFLRLFHSIPGQKYFARTMKCLETTILKLFLSVGTS